MRRRLSPEGLDIRDGIPENWFSELVLWTGLAVPALPFAQRPSSLSANDRETKSGLGRWIEASFQQVIILPDKQQPPRLGRGGFFGIYRARPS
jgi:hypothetical protein